MKKNELNLELKTIKNFNDKLLLKYDLAVEMKLRREGQIQEALQEYLKMYPVFLERIEKPESTISYKRLSKIEFEMGYIEFLLCHFDDAVKYFNKSSETALKDNDTVGSEIGNFRVIHTQYVGGMLEAPEARERMLKSNDSFYTMASRFNKNGNESEATRCRNWVFNIEGRLFGIAINESNVEDAERYYKSFMSEQSTQNLLSSDPVDPGRMILKLSKNGRLSYIKNNFQESLSFFSQYLNASLSEFGAANIELVDHASGIQEITRDYLFAGKALLALGNKEKAKEVFEAGMKLNPDDGNRTFQIKMEMLLSSKF